MFRACVLVGALLALAAVLGCRRGDGFTSPDPATRNPPQEGIQFGKKLIAHRDEGKFEKIKGVFRKMDFSIIQNDFRQIIFAYKTDHPRGAKDVNAFVESLKRDYGGIYQRTKDGLYVILPNARNARDIVIYERNPDGNGEQLVGTGDAAVELYKTEELEKMLKAQGHELAKPW